MRRTDDGEFATWIHSTTRPPFPAMNHVRITCGHKTNNISILNMPHCGRKTHHLVGYWSECWSHQTRQRQALSSKSWSGFHHSTTALTTEFSVFGCQTCQRTTSLVREKTTKTWLAKTHSIKTSMFPVSGAELLHASGATAIAWLMISHKGAYSDNVRPWPLQNGHNTKWVQGGHNETSTIPWGAIGNQMVVLLCYPKVPQAKLPVRVAGQGKPREKGKAKRSGTWLEVSASQAR
jgi:hypothetical protein